jgi:hypothetical protein
MYLFQISGNIRSNEQYQPDGTIFWNIGLIRYVWSKKENLLAFLSSHLKGRTVIIQIKASSLCEYSS